MPQVTVNSAAARITQRNTGRMTLTMRNQSTGGQTIRFSLAEAEGLVIANADYVLSVGEEKSFILAFDGQDVKLPVSAIASADGALLVWAETNEYGG